MMYNLTMYSETMPFIDGDICILVLNVEYSEIQFTYRLPFISIDDTKLCLVECEYNMSGTIGNSDSDMVNKLANILTQIKNVVERLDTKGFQPTSGNQHQVR
jgi:hypothetical protein